MKKDFFYFLLSLIIVSFLGFAIAEIITRIFWQDKSAKVWPEASDEYWYINKRNFYTEYTFPNSDFVMKVKTNSFGHRDDEYDLTKKHSKRILLLGDSTTFGYGINVEDRFDTILEDFFNKRGENVLIINSGVPGWGTLQEISYARDHLELFSPDIIVITFCGDDPNNDLMFKYARFDLEKGLISFPGKRFLRKHSRLYRFIFLQYSPMIHNWFLQKRIAESNNSNQSIELDDKDIKVKNKNVREGEQHVDLYTNKELNPTLKTIKKFYEDFLEFNPDGILLIQAVDPENDNIRHSLNSISNGKSLIYVDLYDDSKVLPPKQKTLPYDNHWSPEMHSVSARNLFKSIK